MSGLKTFLVSLLVFIFLSGQSQPLRFEHLTSEDGISQSEVYTFLQDSRGFIWFGTVDGLNRYDGYEIEVFNTKKGDPHTLTNNTIRALAEDHLGRVWIGTDDGLNYYDPKTELIYQVEGEGFEERLTVWSLLIDENHILVGTNEGLWRAPIESAEKEVIESSFTKIKGISKLIGSSFTTRSIQKSEHGGLWIITIDRVSRIVFQENSNDPVLITEFTIDGVSNLVTGIEDLDGNLWLASATSGLVRYHPDKPEPLHIEWDKSDYNLSSVKISSFAIDNSGNLWVGTQDKGINFLSSDQVSNETFRFENIQSKPGNVYSLNSNLIYSLYVSSNNQLWVGTIGSGVNIYDTEQKQFEHHKFYNKPGESPVSNFIRSVYVDRQNNILIGTHNNGLFLHNRENETFRKLGFNSDAIFYITLYKGDKYFICTGAGIYLVEIKNNILTVLSESNFKPGTPVFYVEESKPGVYWYGSLNGLVRFNVIGDEIVCTNIYLENTSPNISTENCRVVFYNEDSNSLYIGTEGGGLDIFTLDENHYPRSTQFFKSSSQPNSISNNYVRSIIKDKKGNIWIGTYEGLNKLIRDSISGEISFKYYTEEDGLPNNMIQSIVEDDSANIWIGTNGGLSKFIPDEERFINYSVNDGLQSNEFSEHTVFKKDDGEIIIGGINGINTFYPDNIIVSTLKPKTTITEFFLFNEKVKPLEVIDKFTPLKKSIVLSDTIKLLPKLRNIGFKFSAMIFPNADEVKYEYMLDGFDLNWQQTDAKNRIANYTNLSHGQYIFKVRSTNADGVWDEPRQVLVQILVPFRYTWIAYILYVAGILLALLYFSHFTIIRYAEKKELILKKEHTERVHKLDELRTKFFINISHDLRTPLTLISGPLDKLLEKRDLSRDTVSKLQLIKRNVKRLNYLVEQLLDVRKAESGTLVPKLLTEDLVSFAKEEMAHFTYAIKKKGLKLKIDSSLPKIMVNFDPGMISKVFFNIVSNSIKFTEEGEIRISIAIVNKDEYELLKNALFDSFVKVEIKDTGKGIALEKRSKVFDRFYQDHKRAADGYGIGLSHSKELIEAHNGYIEVDNFETVGTKIRFFIPDIEDSVGDEIKSISTSTEDLYINGEDGFSENSIEENEFQKSILVVEDNDDMKNFIASELKQDFKVYLASDGVEGLKIAEEKVPDLIISDVMMSNMDGIEFCEKVRSDIRISHIPIILLTAKLDLETKYKGIETGADDYIPKPFEMEYLLIRINNLLHSRDELRKQFQKNKILEPSAVTVTSIDEKFLMTLKESIEEEMANPDFSIQSLESMMGMSHANFYRKIKSLTGQSGQELLQDMRMKRAYQILSENRGMRVSEVAYMVGFTNPKYFSKCFKETFNIAPSEMKN